MLKPNQKRIDRGLWWDRALSLTEGCTPVSPACKHCWSAGATAMRVCQKNKKIKARYGGLIVPGSKPPTFNGKIRLMWDDINKPTPRQKPAVWSVWNDLFHKDVPFKFQWKAFLRMQFCKQHFFVVCTKRPENIGRMSELVCQVPNLMGMTTAENQEQADKRIPHLLKADFAYRGLSVEPMLGPVDLTKIPIPNHDIAMNVLCRPSVFAPHVDWVIAGPETGPGARECKPEWIEDLYEQCKSAGVPLFNKTKGSTIREFPK